MTNPGPDHYDSLVKTIYRAIFAAGFLGFIQAKVWNFFTMGLGDKTPIVHALFTAGILFDIHALIVSLIAFRHLQAPSFPYIFVCDALLLCGVVCILAGMLLSVWIHQPTVVAGFVSTITGIWAFGVYGLERMDAGTRVEALRRTTELQKWWA